MFANFKSQSDIELRMRAKAYSARLKPGNTLGSNQRVFVDHSYNDHIHEQPTIDEIQALAKLDAKGEFISDRSVPFPLRLHRTLERALLNGKCGIVSWQPHGRCFKVHDKERFESEVLIALLKMKTMNSFIKQLSLYGFRRLTRGSGIDAGGYYHELFLSGREFLVCRMARHAHRGQGHRAAAAPEQEPNFYRMAPCFHHGSDVTEDPIDDLIECFMNEEFGQNNDESGARGVFEGIPFFLLH